MSVDHPPEARPLNRSADKPPNYCLAPNGGGATTLQQQPTRRAAAAVAARRVIVDSSALPDAPANAFVVMLAETMQSVRAVRVVDARVLAAPVWGSIELMFNLTSKVVVNVEPARYASFEIFKDAVRKTMAFKLQGHGAVVYDAQYDQFVFSSIAKVTITVSDLNLLDLLGWTKAFTVKEKVELTLEIETTNGDGKIHLPPFQSFYAWPRSREPAYVHVEQLRSTQQGAARAVTQPTSRSGELVSTVQNMGGLNASLAYAFPQDVLFASVDPVAHHQTVDFATPLARLSRLDVSLRTADGKPYIASRLFLVLDVYSDHQ